MDALFLIQQAGQLLQMPRTHTRTLGTAFDTIASHSYHVSMIALTLAKMEGLSDEDANRCAVVGILHDLAEARTGDHDLISKNYNTCNEQLAEQHQFAKLSFQNNFQVYLDEYALRTSPRSKIVKDADQIAQIYHERVLMRQGNKLAEQRYFGDQEKRVPYLFTQSAKDICHAMNDSNPNERWRDEFIVNSYNKEHLVG